MGVCAMDVPLVERNGGMLARIFGHITDTAARTQRMTAAGIRAQGDAWLSEARDRIAKLEAPPPHDRDAVMHEVDRIQLLLTNAASSVSVLVNVHPDLAARETCEALQREATQLSVRFSQTRPIYEALSKID